MGECVGLKFSRYARAMRAATQQIAVPTGEWVTQMAQVIDEMLWVRDAQSGRILYTNAAFDQFWGAAASREDGDPLLGLVVESDREHLRRLRADVTESPYTTEYQ